MLLVYVERLTNRLGYTLKLIFGDILGIDYSITDDAESFVQYSGHKLSYAKSRLSDEIFIYSKEILFETTIEDKDINVFETNGFPAFFRTYSQDSCVDFDIFAASFYLASRYEEYLPHIQDIHNRYRAEDSLAYKNGFLEKPIVNIWANHLKGLMLSVYPNIEFPNKKPFRYINTMDVDSAYSVLEKSWIRVSWGMVRDVFRGNFSELIYKLDVLRKKKPDPYDNFNYLFSLINKYNLKTAFFVLFGKYGRYDKNISPDNKRFQELVKSLCDYAKVGIHPSYSSLEDPDLVGEQIRKLRNVIHRPVFRNRFHYLRFSLPRSYRILIENKITEEYSMGYSNAIGFRSGLCTDYNFYDLEYDYETKLRIFPFAVMDVALKNGLGLDANASIEKLRRLIDEVVRVEGRFISLWHNESLSDRYEWQGWREVYEFMIEYASLGIKKN